MSGYTVKFYKGDYPERQAAANQDKAIVYVEHHFNAADDPRAQGTEVIVAANASDKSKALGISYAHRISAELGLVLRHPPTGLSIGGDGGRGNGNLVHTNMPAMLVEPCFASNAIEATMIHDDFKRKVMAKVLADTIREQFPNGGLVAFSVGHKYKTSQPDDRGADVLGGGTEADFAEDVLQKAAGLLQTKTIPTTTIMTDTTPVTPAPQPPAVSDLRQRMGKIIVDFEARRDSHGRLVVYALPPDDGGGTFEVAGINEKYDPEASAKLRDMVREGKQAEAEVYAAEYIIKNTDPAVHLLTVNGHDFTAQCPSVEFYLRDCVFNRGLGGATHILQKALGVTPDGQFGPKSQQALVAQLEKSPDELLTQMRTAREWWERHGCGRDESSHFWKGLVNRWNNALASARSLA